MQALFQFDLRGREYAADDLTAKPGGSIDAMCRAELRSKQVEGEEDEVDPLDDPDRKLNSAEREILHRSSLRKTQDPAERETLEEQYRRDRELLGSERDRKIEALRSEG